MYHIAVTTRDQAELNILGEVVHSVITKNSYYAYKTFNAAALYEMLLYMLLYTLIITKMIIPVINSV